jgi:hypothetical protein
MERKLSPSADLHTKMFLKVKHTFSYGEQALRPTSDDSEYEIEIDLYAHRTAAYAQTWESPAEGGDLVDFRAEYDGQEIELNSADRQEALDLLADIEVVDDREYGETG